MVNIIKTHETVLFEAIKGDVSVILELDINHFNKTYNVCVKNQEMIPFKNDSIEVFRLKIRALKSIVNYVETVLKND